jgi:Cdc6-like AAA superfamily ATPase
MNNLPLTRSLPADEDGWFILEHEIVQLFSGAPVSEEALFAGRINEVRRILEAALEPSRHVLLYGERGVGKTSLSNVFWKRYNKSLQTVIAARIQADPSDSFSSLWIKALDEIISTANSVGKSDLIPISNDYEEVSPDLLRREFQRCQANAIPILIIDEFDKLKDKSARELTANVIKYLYDYSVNFTIILVGVAEDVGSLLNDHESIRRALTQIKLERMSSWEMFDVIDTRLSKTPLSMEDRARDLIVTLSRGLPYFTQMLGRFSSQVAVRGRRALITVADVEKALELFIAEEDQTFRDQYRAATESNQSGNIFPEVLLACAMADADENGFFTPTDIIQPLASILKKNKQHAHFQRHLVEFISERRDFVLTRRGIPRQYRYRFTDPMMQPYVLIKGIKDDLLPEEAKAILFQKTQPSLPNVF